MSGKDIAYYFIPGGIIVTVAEKIRPSKGTPIPQADGPEVVNGYLKKSNTASIRPMYSNTPAARAADKEMKPSSSSGTPAYNGLKAPIKRPSSAPAKTAAPVSKGAAPAGTKPAAPVSKPKGTANVGNKTAAEMAEMARIKAEEKAIAAREAAKAAEAAAASAAAGIVEQKTEAPKTAPKAASKPALSKPAPRGAAKVGEKSAAELAELAKKKAAEKAAANKTTSAAPGLKAPIKRPKSLSSNRAVAMAAAAEAEGEKKEERKTDPSDKGPSDSTRMNADKPVIKTSGPAPKPPIKRPKSMSSNRTVAMAAGAEEKTQTQSTDSGITASAGSPFNRPAPSAEPSAAPSPFAAPAAAPVTPSAGSPFAKRDSGAPSPFKPMAPKAPEEDKEDRPSPFARKDSSESPSPFSNPRPAAPAPAKAVETPKPAAPSRSAEPAAPTRSPMRVGKAASSSSEKRIATPSTPINPTGESLENKVREEPLSGCRSADEIVFDRSQPSTAAAVTFRKQLENQEYAPSIATAIVPPVIEKKEPERANPFKPAQKAPIKRPHNGSPFAAPAEEEAEPETPAPAPSAPANHVPVVGIFNGVMPIKKEESPFKPISSKDDTAPNGLKAPIKRPASASVNHAAAMKAEAEHQPEAVSPKVEEPEKISLTAALAAPSLEEAPAPVRKTFTPLAPIPAEKTKPEIDPFKHNSAPQEPAPSEDNGSSRGGLFGFFKR